MTDSNPTPESADNPSPASPPAYGQGDTSFIAAGGEAGLQKLVEAFYRIMGERPEARRLFEMHGDTMPVAIDKLSRFLCGWLGGPRRYNEKYGVIRLPMAHMHLPVTAEDAQMWLECMALALNEQDYDPAFKEYLLSALSVPAGRIVTVAHMARNHRQEAPDERTR